MTAAVMTLPSIKWGEIRRGRTKLYFNREDKQINEYSGRKKAVETIKVLERTQQQKKQLESANLKCNRLELITENSNLKLQLRTIKMRIEDEDYYPPESTIRPEFIQKIKKICARDEGKIYNSMDDFFRSLEE